MMKNTLLWETLQTVEQLEVAFEETLQTIDHINSRYCSMSSRTSSAERHQRLYESEIQAAITGPAKPTHKIHDSPKRRNKKRKRTKQRGCRKSQAKSKAQWLQPVFNLHANCVCELDLDDSNAPIRAVTAQLLQDGIDKEFTSNATATSNGWGMPEGTDRVDLSLSACNTNCCPCCQ
ncbi:hypothetical protein AWZ03_004106 [Drosophila navojoa]|uniref:Uncharacterized protein n=1 Tax=Drosophila navojoa TaxID=7232 RepID=A0A484BKX2_DRONA|nr:uncharacterized protein LOC115562154 [Drosophila navojoa]TDG49423.1 hypothetical protein AWZ03_004106 [Drosophila navojoa]